MLNVYSKNGLNSLNILFILADIFSGSYKGVSYKNNKNP